MSFVDSVLEKIRFNDSYDSYDSEDDDEFDEEYEERRPKTGGGFLSRVRGGGRDDDDYDGYDDAPKKPASRVSNPPVVRGGGSRSGGGISGMQVRVIKPASFDQCKVITDTLLTHRTVVLNMEGLDVSTAQRIVDFACGSCYALHGNFMKISHFIFVITPEEVDIAGDITGEGGEENVLGAIAGAAAASGAAGGMGNAFYSAAR